MRHVSLERGRILFQNGPRDVLLAEALFEVLKLLKLMEKVDARIDKYFRTRLESWNYIKLTDLTFSCLPTTLSCVIYLDVHSKVFCLFSMSGWFYYLDNY